MHCFMSAAYLLALALPMLATWLSLSLGRHPDRLDMDVVLLDDGQTVEAAGIAYKGKDEYGGFQHGGARVAS